MTWMKFPALLLIAGSMAALTPRSRVSERLQLPDASSEKPTIYVSDFRLDIAPPSGPAAAAAAGAAPPSASPGGKTPDDEMRAQASRLVDLLAGKIVTELKKSGYNAERLRGAAPRPEQGVRVRGLFAEIDKENHWRRAMIRTPSDTGKMQVLVSVSNLAKPEQALYEIAQLAGNEDKPGAVITVSPYVPLAKYELDKEASEQVIQKTAALMAVELAKLLNANPAAVGP